MLLASAKKLWQSQPPADPGPPAIESQGLQSPSTDQIVYLNPGRAPFGGSAEVIVNHHPAPFRDPVAVRVDVASDIRVCVENKQADLARSRHFPNFRDRSLLERRAVYQGNCIEQSSARKVLFEVFENVPGRQPVIL